jgi:hypothetical protein
MNFRDLPCPLAIGEQWQLPSGRIVCIREVDAEQDEITVRYVDEQGAMAPGFFTLTARFILRGRKVGHGR